MKKRGFTFIEEDRAIVKELFPLEDYLKFLKYKHEIFSDNTITDRKDAYTLNRENDKNKNKDRDDFEL